ncbi:50S ribosomal protein L17 [Bdellovibrio sp. NC01]|uniref:50S ribosomal protein L17 n=1 Tax=Bdellovibrio sp. NC01 TaxID=2220073 RepID=UPI001157E1BC|nr:50S ribosomal protein L17 [Bdellovibrio sp. NC01]QDK38790.1 50S ribosomal protein L17 [Bdellovibrio sp. NC01]
MSSHRRRVKHFDRKSGPRKALIRGLVNSLVEHGRITTTVDRAKEIRRHVEKAITLGKKGDLATTRLLLSRYPNQEVVSTIVKDLAPRFKTRPGGYTRIIKIGRRPGDTAEMAFLEFVDYDFEAKTTANETAKAEKAAPKAASKAKKASTKLVAAKKKTVKKAQKKARATAR